MIVLITVSSYQTTEAGTMWFMPLKEWLSHLSFSVFARDQKNLISGKRF